MKVDNVLIKKIKFFLLFTLLSISLLKIYFLSNTFGFQRGDAYEYALQAYDLVLNYKWTGWEIRNPLQSIFFTPVVVLLKVFNIQKGNFFLTAINSQSLIINFLCVYLIYLIVKKIKGELAGLIAAFLLSINPLFNQWSYSTVAEIPSTLLILAGFYLCLLVEEHKKTKIISFFAGLLIGFGFLVKFSNFTFIAVTLLYFYLRKKINVGLYILLGFTTITLIGGLVDLVIYGEFFHSLIAFYNYNKSNVALEYYKSFPPVFYLSGFPDFFSILEQILLIYSFFVFFLNKKSLLFFLTFSFQLFILSLIPHKEFRFILILIPLVNALCAVGLIDILHYLKPLPKFKFYFFLIILLMLNGLIFHYRNNNQLDLAPNKGGIIAVKEILSLNKDEKVIIAAPPWSIGKEFLFQEEFTLLDADPGLFYNNTHMSEVLTQSAYFITIDIDYYDQDKKIRKLLTKKNYVFVKNYDQFSLYKKSARL